MGYSVGVGQLDFTGETGCGLAGHGSRVGCRWAKSGQNRTGSLYGGLNGCHGRDLGRGRAGGRGRMRVQKWPNIGQNRFATLGIKYFGFPLAFSDKWTYNEGVRIVPVFHL